MGMQLSLAEEGWFVIPFFFTFLSLYLFGYFIFFQDRTPQIRVTYSSVLICVFHFLTATILGVIAFFSDTNRGLSAANTTLQNIVLDFSIAYFITDLLHFVVFLPSYVHYFAHQLAMLFFVFTCRFMIGNGAVSVFVLVAVF